jgi:protein-tyrosine phosphatase
MIDIHTHILPGVDDGVPDIGDALLLAEDAAAQGVTAMVATPHLYWGDRPALSAARIREGVEQLNALLGAKGTSLKVLPGCEIPLAPDLLRRLERDEWMSLGEGTRAVLVEPLWGEWPAFGQTVIKEMLAAGWTVVLAHPDRTPALQRNLSLLEELVAMGVHLQVTTGSLIPGRASPAAARCAYELLDRRLVSVVASDCHGVNHRHCDMGEAAELLRRTYGRHVVQMLTTGVPRALLRGEKVELAQVWKNTRTDESRWKRLLRAVLRRETDDG